MSGIRVDSDVSKTGLGHNSSRRLECDHSHGTAGAIHDFEWRSDDNGAGQRQKIEIGQAGQSELAVAVHHEVIAEGRVEAGRLSGICADGLDTNSKHVALFGEK